MDKPQFRHLFHPKLEHPVFVEGLPGFGNVGKIAAQLLIEYTKAKCFAELYSPSFPDYVIVNKNGICRPPCYKFYASSTNKNQFIILTGDTQPSLEDVKAHYQICDQILDFAEKYGCKFIVTMGGVPTPQPRGEEIYVAATSEKLASENIDKGAILYRQGRIMGATGLLLGLAKERGLEGLCLLGSTTGFKADRGAALSVFKFLMKTLGAEVEAGF
ncbi:MAG: PAC2 family protein [Candidatus Bathyarchaeota archaeon BA2]|nr:MAG: PAC2 family protein [Candidatus Bathyarchaeota archaeon BA2]